MTSIKNKNLDDILSSLFPNQVSNPNNNDREIFITPSMVNTRNTMNAGLAINQNRMVKLKEGFKKYHRLEAPSHIALAMETGLIVGVSNKEFEYCGTINAYVIEGINKPIDLGNIQPDKLIKLVVLREPFIGPFLVSESAIVTFSQQNTPTILKG